MNRILLLPPAVLVLAALTACQPQDTTTTQAGPGFTPLPASTGTGPCTADYGLDGTGLTVNSGNITGTVSANCFPQSDQPGDTHIEVVLIRKVTNTGQTTTPASHAYTSTQDEMSVTAHCAPGLWTLATNITTIINGAATVTGTYGQDIDVTATDCAD
jgi:hypothetical protein